MKKFKVFLVVVCIMTSLSVSASRHRQHDYDQNNYYNYQNNDGRDDCVTVPLDGGLLTVLGAAGIGFFLFRKNRKKEQ